MAKSNSATVEVDQSQSEYSATKDSTFNDHSLSSRSRLRTQMDEDIAEFFKDGGQVQVIPKNLRSDPPQKPQSNYGSRPI